jgi:hypothetical protein
MKELTQKQKIEQAYSDALRDVLADLQVDAKIDEYSRLKAKTRKARQISEGILLSIRRD